MCLARSPFGLIAGAVQESTLNRPAHTLEIQGMGSAFMRTADLITNNLRAVEASVSIDCGREHVSGEHLVEPWM